MNPAKVDRKQLTRFTDLPNVGPAMAKDFVRLGYSAPTELVGADPLALYQALCLATGARHDPCVLDTFMSVTDFLAGAPPQPWWHYTAERKRRYGQLP
ncbi:MAG TPA: helix-hairpin-helix domain-containing protein [Chiayiivirga sp.]|nr:helix-hairpin-helix domain-containing protein [Chiayiivirga sp.]